MVSVPHRQLTKVLLPEPFGPISPSRSSGATVRLMPSSATKPPKRLPSLGPMAGQNHHYAVYAPEKVPYAIERYVKETTGCMAC